MSPPQRLLGQVEYRLNAAAEVHQAKSDVVNVALEHPRREVPLEGEKSNCWQVVEQNDGEDDEDHLEGSLLHWMHLISVGPGLLQSPHDCDVAHHHEGKNDQDHYGEDFVKVGDVSQAFNGSVRQDDDPHHHS